MKTYLITCELIYPESSYADLISYLKSANSWAKLSKSVWIVKTNVRIELVRDGIQKRVNNGDLVLVVELQSNTYWASFGVPGNVTDWMKNNI